MPSVPDIYMGCGSVLGGGGAEGKSFKSEAGNTEILPEAEEVGRTRQRCRKRLLVVPALGFRGADGRLFITPSDRAEICEVPGLTVGGDPWIPVWGEPPVPTLQAAESPLDTHSPRDGKASVVTAVGTRH